MEIQKLSIDDIKPYEKNPRKNDASVDKVAESISEFGFKVPIVIDKNNVIVTGHTRHKAAKKLGLAEVPVIMADDLTEEQIKAFRLADNKAGESSEWDLDLLFEEMNGIFDIDMTIFGFEDPEQMEEEEPEEIEEDGYDVSLNEEPKTKQGQLYKLGRHFLIVDDCTKPEVIQKLTQGAQIDLYITDPPYGVNYDQERRHKTATGDKTIKNDNLDDDQFREFLKNAFVAADSVMRPGAAFYIWHAQMQSYNFFGACRDMEWKPRQTLIWNKKAMVIGRQDYQWKHEPCLYGWKEGASHYFIDDRTNATVIDDVKKEDIKKMKKDELQNLLEQLLSDKISTTIIDCERPTNSDLHPTMKPLKLIGHLIKNSSKIGETVLDSFGGSGSILMACEQLGRTCYTSEIDPKYADVIIERWETYTGRKAELIQ